MDTIYAFEHTAKFLQNEVIKNDNSKTRWTFLQFIAFGASQVETKELANKLFPEESKRKPSSILSGATWTEAIVYLRVSREFKKHVRAVEKIEVKKYNLEDFLNDYIPFTNRGAIFFMRRLDGATLSANEVKGILNETGFDCVMRQFYNGLSTIRLNMPISDICHCNKLQIEIDNDMYVNSAYAPSGIFRQNWESVEDPSEETLRKLNKLLEINLGSRTNALEFLSDLRSHFTYLQSHGETGKPLMKIIILQGLNGTGKSTLVDVIKFLFKPSYVYEGKVSRIGDRFQSQFKRKALIVLDEGQIENEDDVKVLCDLGIKDFESKGVDIHPEYDWALKLVTTNETYPVKNLKNIESRRIEYYVADPRYADNELNRMKPAALKFWAQFWKDEDPLDLVAKMSNVLKSALFGEQELPPPKIFSRHVIPPFGAKFSNTIDAWIKTKEDVFSLYEPKYDDYNTWCEVNGTSQQYITTRANFTARMEELKYYHNKTTGSEND